MKISLYTDDLKSSSRTRIAEMILAEKKKKRRLDKGDVLQKIKEGLFIAEIESDDL